MNKVRLAKFISDSGYCSRRTAEQLILSGKVSVNKEIIKTVVYFINENDIIRINNKIIEPRTDTILIALNKPINVITSAADNENRKTIYDILPKEYRNLKYIGRLDYKTEGLLLLTNDGNLARIMTLPTSQLQRTYIAKVHGNISENLLNKARNGITIDEIHYAPMKIEILKTSKTNSELKISITEGKNNEIRKVMAGLNLQVAKLKRIEYGIIKLGNLSSGEIKKITKKTIDEILKICHNKNS